MGGRLSQQSLQTMDSALTSMQSLQVEDFHKSISYDNTLHGAIVKQLELPRLTKAWDDLNLGNIISYYVGSTDHAAAVQRQYTIHRQLLESLQTGDVDLMCKAVTDHYMSTIQRRLREQGLDESSFAYPTDLSL